MSNQYYMPKGSLFFLSANRVFFENLPFLCFSLPLLEKILRGKSSASCSTSYNGSNHGVRAVVLVPTRELCAQVYKALQSLIYYCDEVITLAVLSATRGGRASGEEARQKAMLRDRPDVIVATPAGLLTHIRNGDVVLKESMETLVVDEADLVLSFDRCRSLYFTLNYYSLFL